MYCINCGAAIPLKEWGVARTCGSCGAILYRDHETAVVGDDAKEIGVSPIFASPEEARIAARRHPSTVGARTRNLHYYQVTGNIGGQLRAYWVQASTDGVAREMYRKYVSRKGWKLFNGDLGYSWPDVPSERYPAQRESLDVTAPSRDIPPEYLYRANSRAEVELVRPSRTEGE